MPGPKPKVVSELKSLLDGFPASRRERVIAAMREVFAEIAAECEGEPGHAAIAREKACEA